MVASGERAAEHPEICAASIEAAAWIAGPLLVELSEPNSVLYRTVNQRMSGLPVEDALEVATLLHPDPSKSGIVVPRWRLQEGRLPEDAVRDGNPEQAVAIWSANAAAIPRLKVPEGAEPDVMTLADRLQQRGGGPVVFAREDLSSMEDKPNTLVQVVGAANNANRMRIGTALMYLAEHGNNGQHIVGTVKAKRTLVGKEPEVIQAFAPDATNELELFIDSAIEQGFLPNQGDRYGMRLLPDGSAYTKMKHSDTEVTMTVVAPHWGVREDGSEQTGVFNGYQTMLKHPEIVAPDFTLEGSNLIHDTSTHYGIMAAMNNLKAVDELGISLASFRVMGDNSATRAPQAHLIEQGLALNALLEVIKNPRLAPALREQLARLEP